MSFQSAIVSEQMRSLFAQCIIPAKLLHPTGQLIQQEFTWETLERRWLDLWELFG